MAAKPSTTKTAPKVAAKPPAKSAAKPAAAKPARKGAAPASEPKTTAKPVVKAAAPATVTLKHLSAGLAGRHGTEKKQADAVVADVFETVVTHLKSGDRVKIGGFGILDGTCQRL